MKRWMALLLALSLTLSALAGCTPSWEREARESDTLGGSASAEGADLSLGSAAAAEFSAALFQSCLEEGENLLISPASVLCALAMTANGAEGETLRQMEAVLGLPAEELNVWLNAWLHSLPDQVTMANGVWFREEGFTVSRDFLQNNADYYGAEIRQGAFDEATRREINSWAEERTGGLVKDLVKELPSTSVMCLVNALAFDGAWMTPYQSSQTEEGVFTLADGAQRAVTYLNSTENRYLEDGGAVGFLKYYSGGAFAFAAILPEEGVSAAEYAATLTGDRLLRLLDSVERAEVKASLPKFEAVYETELVDALRALGMEDAFNGEAADFSGAGTCEEGELYISSVRHKCFVSVEENGAKAGAASSVVMQPSSAPEELEVKRVVLDRPFVYLIVDTRYGVPLFMGVLADPGA